MSDMVKIESRTVLNVLGQSQDGEQFHALTDEIGEAPFLLCKNEYESVHLFRSQGLQFAFDETKQVFSSVFFHFGSAMAESGNVSKYNGDLPGGIEFGNSPTGVKELLEMEPISSNMSPGPSKDSPRDLWQEYSLDRYVIRCMFVGADGPLKSVSVRLLETK
ncbi:MAG: hypothetical protein IT342_07945 [Candidatus Melainabacteria bacterium]|nr:hypothetical protein [Candidatus Melainabacteria bacterium]